MGDEGPIEEAGKGSGKGRGEEGEGRGKSWVGVETISRAVSMCNR